MSPKGGRIVSRSSSRSATASCTSSSFARTNLSEAGVRILAYCLMTNHVHFIAVPDARSRSPFVRSGPRKVFPGAEHSPRPVRSPVAGAISFLSDVACAPGGRIAIRGGKSVPGQDYGFRPEHYPLVERGGSLQDEDGSLGVLDPAYWERAGGHRPGPRFTAGREKSKEIRNCGNAITEVARTEQRMRRGNGTAISAEVDRGSKTRQIWQNRHRM